LSGELSYLIDKWLAPQRIRQQGLLNEKDVAKYVTEFRTERNIMISDCGQ
jgi:hypothetical protein